MWNAWHLFPLLQSLLLFVVCILVTTDSYYSQEHPVACVGFALTYM